MKKLIMCSLLLCCIMFFVAGSAFAKPGADQDGPYVGNGMPSGPHANLNLHGKDPANFLCPDKTVPNNGLSGEDFAELGLPEGYWKNTCDTPPPYDETCYKQDTSIHIPEYSTDPICGGITQTIVIQSGKKGGKPRKGTLTLPTDQIIVTDACTECFATEWDMAEFQLPPCDAGYKVYGRALGKPSEDDGENIRRIIINAGDLLTAEDESGKNLLELGEIIGTTITTATGEVVNTTRQKGGKPVTVTFSDLFKFTGTICYLEEPEGWDADAEGNSEVLLCCTDLDDDDIYDVCVLKQDTDLDTDVDGDDLCPEWKGPIDLGGGEWVCYLDEEFDNTFDGGEITVESGEFADCSTLSVESKTAFCQFHDDVWIFSIADLVEYYFGVVNDGIKLFQIRFYPIDPECFASSP